MILCTFICFFLLYSRIPNICILILLCLRKQLHGQDKSSLHSMSVVNIYDCHSGLRFTIRFLKLYGNFQNKGSFLRIKTQHP